MFGDPSLDHEFYYLVSTFAFNGWVNLCHYGSVALSGICGTEYFSIHKKEMVLADDKYNTQASMKAIKEERLGKYMVMDPAERKWVQALIDAVTTMVRGIVA